MSDFVRLICPNLKCRAILSVPGNTRGMKVRCSQCNGRISVPKVHKKTTKDSHNASVKATATVK